MNIQRKLYQNVLSRVRPEDHENLMAHLEKCDFGYFLETFAIPRQSTKNAYEDLCRVFRQFSELCRIQPAKSESHKLDYYSVRRKILSNLLKKSLHFDGENAYSELQGSPFETRSEQTEIDTVNPSTSPPAK